MPAVADRHVHIELSDPMAVLLRGVTAVRDLAWPPERIFALADASELPSFSGPLIRAAGPMLTGPGGYPTKAGWAPSGTGREVEGAEDAADAVAELVTRGATAIKVSLNAEDGPTPTDSELMAICDAAHAAELQYLFTLPNTPQAGSLNPAQQRLAATMRRYWTGFAARGIPSATGARPRWPAYSTTNEQFQRLVPPKPTTTAAFAAEHQCAFWSPG